jgi:hypothetical protein
MGEYAEKSSLGTNSSLFEKEAVRKKKVFDFK